jgi:hypothetical protein
MAFVEDGITQVVKGSMTLSAHISPKSFFTMVNTPRANLLALASGTLKQSILPSQLMNVCLTRFFIEKVSQIMDNFHEEPPRLLGEFILYMIETLTS